MQNPNNEAHIMVPVRSNEHDSNNNSTNNTNSTGNPPKKAAFVHKLYAMLSDAKLNHLIWWNNDVEEGTFALQPGADFAQALTGYFKHGNVASFVRQLHMYGFHKVCDQPAANPNGNSHPVWEFIHSSGMFKKGDESSLALIKRRTSSNATKIKSDLNRSLSSTPAMDMSYQQHQQQLQQQPGIPHPQHQQQQAYFYSTAPPPGYVPQPQFQQIQQPPPPYGIPVHQGPPMQPIVYYPVPHRYGATPASGYPHSVTPPFQDQAYAYPPQYQHPPQMAPQQQQQHIHLQQQSVPTSPRSRDLQRVQAQAQHSPQQQQYYTAQKAPTQRMLQQQQQQQHHQLLQQYSIPPQHQHQHPPQPQSLQHPPVLQQAYVMNQQQPPPPPPPPHQQHIVRQTTPLGSSASRNPQSRSQTPQQAQQPMQHYPDSRINSTVERLSITSKELMHSQAMLHLKSDILNHDLKESSNDTLRAADTLPSVKSSLDDSQYAEFQDKISSLRANVSNRVERYEEEAAFEHPKSHQDSVVSNSSQISFYENNSRPRIPSMFVDPLAPIPHAQQQQVQQPSSAQSQPSDAQLPLALPQQQEQQQQQQLPGPGSAAENPESRSPAVSEPNSTRRTPSIANIVSEPLSGDSLLRRAGSHPGLTSMNSAGVATFDKHPRSMSNDHIAHTGSLARDAVFQEPRSNSVTSNPRTSIPGIGHLHSQIRPSLVEFHRTSSPVNASSSIASGNGNSIFSNKASISSVSTSVRNSIPQLLNEPIKEESQRSLPDAAKLEGMPAGGPTRTTTPATTSPKMAPATAQPPPSSTASNPQSYKPQIYTPKQFHHRPSSGLRNDSTVSPKSARTSNAKISLPPITSSTKRESEDPIESPASEVKKSKVE